MDYLSDAIDNLKAYLPLLAVIAGAVVALWLADRFTKRRLKRLSGENQFGRQLTMIALTIIAAVIVILNLPAEQETRYQLLGLIGIAITATIAISSTTFAANAMAGIMLRAMNNFRPGDFISVGDQFGRVTGRGLFHTEIQTEDRDLTSLPNFYLVSNPVKVVRSSGTIVSANVSLGYDTPHAKIQDALLAAAEQAELQEPFVQVLDLGDFSISYRVAGFLPDVKQLVTARSRLRVSMIDALHAADIEIVSPAFMIQRPQHPGERTIAEADVVHAAQAVEKEPAPEDIMFDKAEKANQVEALREEREQLLQDLQDLEKGLADADDGARERLERDLAIRKRRLKAIEQTIEHAEEGLKNEK